MKRKSYADMNCSVARTLDIVGDPWTLLIVRDVLWGYHRFNEFQERFGIARNTLTDRLATLVGADVLTKVAYQDNPERFEYRLTRKGRALEPVLIALMQWGDRWSGIAEPPVVLVDRDTGRTLEPTLIDTVTGESLDQIKVRAIGEPVGDGHGDVAI